MKQWNNEVENIKGRDQASAELVRLAERQRTALATTFADLLGDGGPLEETADEMIRGIREWREKPSTTETRRLDE